MNWRFDKTTLVVVATMCTVTLAWSQSPTPAAGCTADTWTATSTNFLHISDAAVWTGSEIIVWSGEYAENGPNSGERYNPSTDTWTSINTTNAPTGRRFNTSAVWAGSEMIVWGGADANTGVLLNDGGRYNPTTDTWTALSTTNAPTARSIASAVWTGAEMIVWGGDDNTGVPPNSGGRYNPSTDTWLTMSTSNAPSHRYVGTVVWTGSEMILWGGLDTAALNTGGRYNPSTDTWLTMSTSNAPSPRYRHTAVWTGSEMIVWGGEDNFNYSNTGGRYNPTTDTWTDISATNTPVARATLAAVWTGSEMIVWGGHFYDGIDHNLNSGGRYNPTSDSWILTNTTGAPDGRVGFAIGWTGSEMVVWGGRAIDTKIHDRFFNTGGRYCVQPFVVHISGNVSYCSNPTPGPVPNVTLTVTGDVTSSSVTNASGNYMLVPPSGGSYDVTPAKGPKTPGTWQVNTIDVIAAQRHFLNLGTPLSGCRLLAADVNGDSMVNSVDVIAIKRFYLGLSTGIANTGKYRFIPATRSYLKVVADQPNQNYDALIFGDVASPFVE